MTARTTRLEQDTPVLGSPLSAITTAAVVIIDSVGATATASLGIIAALVLVL
ncbi:hypothetical protein ACQPW1_18445 [Nocardia sp. CA-128927]|uniref:hypothetical protein n=1 Tax=Nocardia sp. CA-128927 TaxID=3239975 RepID=UPI003D980596